MSFSTRGLSRTRNSLFLIIGGTCAAKEKEKIGAYYPWNSFVHYPFNGAGNNANSCFEKANYLQMAIFGRDAILPGWQTVRGEGL
jgi:hypothetical protein